MSGKKGTIHILENNKVMEKVAKFYKKLKDPEKRHKLGLKCSKLIEFGKNILEKVGIPIVKVVAKRKGVPEGIVEVSGKSALLIQDGLQKGIAHFCPSPQNLDENKNAQSVLVSFGETIKKAINNPEVQKFLRDIFSRISKKKAAGRGI